jgi:hypothetical protein
VAALHVFAPAHVEFKAYVFLITPPQPAEFKGRRQRPVIVYIARHLARIEPRHFVRGIPYLLPDMSEQAPPCRGWLECRQLGAVGQIQLLQARERPELRRQRRQPGAAGQIQLPQARERPEPRRQCRQPGAFEHMQRLKCSATATAVCWFVY